MLTQRVVNSLVAGPRYQPDANTRLSGGGCLLGCPEWRAAEEVHQDVAGVGIEVDLLDEQADELALLLLSPCIEDLTEDLPATLHDA